MKRIICFVLVLAVLGGLLSAFALMPGESRVVIGEDLTLEEITRVYRDFQLERGTVRELTVSNEEEHALFGDALDTSVIGSVACSCIYLRVLPEGSGCTVERHNISWCTEEMYRSALRTAGIEDVAVVITAPFEVSGTAALTGILKAYEDMTGTQIPEDAKAVSVRELLLTGELAEQLGSYDASLMVESLKGALEYTSSLSDAALSERIREVAEEYHIHLNDSQVRQLLTLCRQLEKLDDLQLEEKVKEVKQTVEQLQDMRQKAAELQEKAKGWRARLEEMGRDAKAAYEKVSDWMERNSGKFERLWGAVRAFFTEDEPAQES